MRLVEEAAIIERTAAQLVRCSRRLLLMGEAQAAVMVARAAIDTRLRELICWTPGAVVKKSRGRRGFRATIAERAAALKKAGVLTRGQEKDLKRWADIGNRAAHNSAISLADVFDIVHGAASFVESFTDPDEERFPEYFTN